MNYLRFLLLTGLLAFGSCMSLPLSESTEECTLVMRVKKINPEEFENPRDYIFVLNDNKTNVYAYVGSDLVIWKIKEPGTRITKVFSHIRNQESVRGDNSTIELDIRLPYEPGKVIVLDDYFEVLTKEVRKYEYTSWVSFKKLPLAEKQKITSDVKSWKNSELWNFD